MLHKGGAQAVWWGIDTSENRPFRSHLAASQPPCRLLDELPEVPSRFWRGDIVAEFQVDELLEVDPVPHLKLRGLVGEAVVLLQDKHLEHQHRVERERL